MQIRRKCFFNGRWTVPLAGRLCFIPYWKACAGTFPMHLHSTGLLTLGPDSTMHYFAMRGRCYSCTNRYRVIKQVVPLKPELSDIRGQRGQSIPNIIAYWYPIFPSWWRGTMWIKNVTQGLNRLKLELGLEPTTLWLWGQCYSPQCTIVLHMDKMCITEMHKPHITSSSN